MGALTNGQFKSEINSAFTSTDIINSWCWKKDFTMTNGNKILERICGIVCDDRLIVMSRAAPSLEEAENRLLLHVKEAVMRGRTNVIVRTVDSNIIVILLGFMDKFLEINPGTSIVVDYGVTNRRLININDSYRNLGDSISKSAMFFHALSGCDSTASFFKKNKKHMYKCWMTFAKNTELTSVFKQLSFHPSTTTCSKVASRQDGFGVTPSSRKKLPTPCVSEFGWDIVTGTLQIKWIDEFNQKKIA